MSQCKTCCQTVAAFKYESASKQPAIRKKEYKYFLFKYHFNTLIGGRPMWNQNITSQISHYITEVETNPQAQGLLISENFITLPSKAVET